MYDKMPPTPASAEWVEKRHKAILLAVFIPFLFFAAWTAATRPLWVDEIFTNYVARSGGLNRIWQTLLAGCDNHPPMDYWGRGLSMRAFGPSHWAFRLPSIPSLGTAILCIYLFVRRRLGDMYGLIAMLVPLSTIA